jgi:hypothetical protein
LGTSYAYSLGDDLFDVGIDIINGLRVHAPHARVIFNYNPTSTLEAVQRAFPIDEKSAGSAVNYVCIACPEGELEHDANEWLTFLLDLLVFRANISTAVRRCARLHRKDG